MKSTKQHYLGFGSKKEMKEYLMKFRLDDHFSNREIGDMVGLSTSYVFQLIGAQPKEISRFNWKMARARKKLVIKAMDREEAERFMNEFNAAQLELHNAEKAMTALSDIEEVKKFIRAVRSAKYYRGHINKLVPKAEEAKRVLASA